MKFIVATLTLLFTATTYAQGVRVQGVGNMSCGEYLQTRSRPSVAQDAIFASWVWGYMAGFNMESKQPTSRSTPDQASTLAYVDKYCRDNPLESVIGATNALILDLGGKRNPR
jgi:hypothetical protein